MEKIEGGLDTWDVGMQDIKDCLTDINVDDIHATGSLFIWWNGQDNNPTYKKLDRALGNACWFNQMSNATVTFGSRGLSDHNPIILHSGLCLPKVRKPFQFFSYILCLEDFNSTVAFA